MASLSHPRKAAWGRSPSPTVCTDSCPSHNRKRKGKGSFLRTDRVFHSKGTKTGKHETQTVSKHYRASSTSQVWSVTNNSLTIVFTNKKLLMNQVSCGRGYPRYLLSAMSSPSRRSGITPTVGRSQGADLAEGS